MKNKDIAFFSYIIVWTTFLILYPVQATNMVFAGIGLFLLFLKVTILRNWWDKDIRRGK